MTVPQLALYLALGSGSVYAQNTPPLEIRGTVVEGSLGVAGATVTLYEFGQEPALATTRSVFATTSTDANGQFTLHPARAGEYYVEVKKDGYFAESFDGPTVDPVDSTGDPVSIDQEHPLRERKFSLMRLGELRGRIVDEDGAPLANLRIGIRPGTITPVVTDQDGYFTATKLRPGDYSVSVIRRGPEILPKFSEEDLKIVDQDLQVSNWPGVPVPIHSGASLSVGTITARKTSYYRAHLSVQVTDCAEGEQWMFSTTMGGFGPSVPCGKQFLVRNLAPGSYTFMLFTSGRTGERRWASADVEVTDRNLEVAMTVSSGADISARLVAMEGVTLPSGKITITVGPVPGSVLGNQMVAERPAGQFLLRGLPAIHHRVSVNGLAPNFYVKEIRYNGLIVADNVFTPIPGAPGQMDLLIDDKPATISGSVAGHDKVSARVMVVAVKWPLPAETPPIQALLNTASGTVADDHGRFQIVGLAPGEYRVLAVTTGDLALVPPDTVSRAEKVTLERGSSQSVSLKIVEP